MISGSVEMGLKTFSIIFGRCVVLSDFLPYSVFVVHVLLEAQSWSNVRDKLRVNFCGLKFLSYTFQFICSETSLSYSREIMLCYVGLFLKSSKNNIRNEIPCKNIYIFILCVRAVCMHKIC